MGNLHLCQPDADKSCAACCGIYNYVDNLRSPLMKRFAYRTQLFEKVRQGSLGLDAYRDVIRHREDGKRIYHTIYTCEFVGYLNQSCSKVGCMLHPMQNQGQDLRVVSFYGRDICEGHFCPSYEKLTLHEAGIVIDIVQDWYLYGALITDIDFIKTFFKIVQDELGEEVRRERIAGNHNLHAILKRYFDLKITWPFRDTTRPRFGKYFFVGEAYDIDRIDYAAMGASTPSYDSIYLSLASRFAGIQELDLANTMLNMIKAEFIDAYRRSDRQNY